MLTELVAPKERGPIGPAELGFRLVMQANHQFPGSDPHQAIYYELKAREQSSYFLRTIAIALLHDTKRLEIIRDTANKAHRRGNVNTPEKSVKEVKRVLRLNFKLAERLEHVPTDQLAQLLASYDRRDTFSRKYAGQKCLDLIAQTGKPYNNGTVLTQWLRPKK